MSTTTANRVAALIKYRADDLDPTEKAALQFAVDILIGLDCGPGRTKPRKHGTRYAYKRGCRCDECRAAERAVKQRQRKPAVS